MKNIKKIIRKTYFHIQSVRRHAILRDHVVNFDVQRRESSFGIVFINREELFRFSR